MKNQGTLEEQIRRDTIFPGLAERNKADMTASEALSKMVKRGLQREAVNFLNRENEWQSYVGISNATWFLNNRCKFPLFSASEAMVANRLGADHIITPAQAGPIWGYTPKNYQEIHYFELGKLITRNLLYNVAQKEMPLLYLVYCWPLNLRKVLALYPKGGMIPDCDDDANEVPPFEGFETSYPASKPFYVLFCVPTRDFANGSSEQQLSELVKFRERTKTDWQIAPLALAAQAAVSIHLVTGKNILRHLPHPDIAKNGKHYLYYTQSAVELTLKISSENIFSKPILYLDHGMFYTT